MNASRRSASRPVPLLAAVWVAVLSASCAAAGPATVDQAWQQVLQQQGDNSCSGDAQCHSIGVGSKPCGGPGAYLAWSSQHNDGVALTAAVQRHAELAKAASKAAGRMSTCDVVPDPGAVCKATDKTKRCELQER